MRASLTKNVLMIACMLLILPGCQQAGTMEEQRSMWKENPEKAITFAVVGRLPFLAQDTDFMKGVYLALEEVNDSGGVDGRLVEVQEHDDEASVMKGTIIAQQLAENTDISAVIGHTSSHVALPASTIYNENRMLMLSPVVSNSELTQRNYSYVFQNIPTDDEMGRAMAIYAHQQGIRRILIYYADNAYGRGLANAFEDAARDLGIIIVDRTPPLHDEIRFLRAVDRWKALDTEAVFVADSMRTGSHFLNRLQSTSLKLQILADAGMDVHFIETFGEFSEGAVLTTAVNPDKQTPEGAQFIEAYREVYGSEPDEWAVQGYESIHLLAAAVEKAQTPVSHDVAQALSQIEWDAMTGQIRFDENGRVEGKSIYPKKVVDGKFTYQSEALR